MTTPRRGRSLARRLASPLGVFVASLALGITGCTGPKPAATTTPDTASTHVFPSRAELLTLIQNRVDAKRATGIVLAVREADGTRTIVAYGDAGPGALPLGPKSVFEIGSISKVFGGILLADMDARGQVKLDDPVQRHAHPGVTIPTRGDRPIRLVDLATHTSGLPRLPANLAPADPANPYADYTVAQLHEFLAAFTLPRDAGAEHEYSNLGAGLLGHILATVGGTSWEALVQTRILDPLGMTMTGITLSAEMTEHLARGHNEEGQLVSNWDFPTLSAAGALRSNAEDMLRFVEANLGGRAGSLGDAMRASHQPRIDVGPHMRIGLGWFIKTTDAHTIVWHNGGTGGYRTFVGFDVERQIGVVVLENSALGSDDLGFHLLDASIPLVEPVKVRQEVAVAPEILAEYVGVYQLSPTFHINITLIDGALYSQATNQPMLPIYPESESEFFLKVVDAQLTFVRDASGAVASLVLHQGGANPTAPRLHGAEAIAAIASIAGEERLEVDVPTSTLKEYVGVYQLNPSFKIHVSLKDGRLQVQATGQPTIPIFAESDADFFFKAVDAQITFTRDELGSVTNLVLHQGGMDQSAAKVE